MDNPRCKWSYLLASIYTFLGANKYKVEKGNSINKKNAYLKNCKIHIKGHGNIVDFGEAANYFIGCTVHISGNNNHIILGERNVCINARFVEEDDGNEIRFGDRNRILGSTEIAALEGTQIIIGDNCLFSSDIFFRTSDSHAIYDINTESRINKAKSIKVGNHVWFGAKTTILKGVEIADGSVIGIGSIVTKSIAENTIAVGAPAIVVRSNIYWDLQRKKK